ncbi:hypothetical protein CEXT_68741 [Caerostris extrusa]|uniref:Uncharacterized protein n=1 Tax=Caerostris extrusa TaxID=172846 RepID=A0AAV4U106_CAEEX|nr:hypothetical protein CEXT_68741 [Caerostris extrusa]
MSFLRTQKRFLLHSKKKSAPRRIWFPLAIFKTISLVGTTFLLTSISTVEVRISVFFVHSRQLGHVHGSIIEYLAILLEKWRRFSPATECVAPVSAPTAALEPQIETSTGLVS